LNGRDSLLVAPAAMDKRDIHLARPGYRAAITKMADRCTRDGACNDPLSLSRTTGCPVCPGCGHPGPSNSVSREAAWVQSLEISVPGLPLAGRVVIAPASAWGWRLGLGYGGD
jgi:hypothetical protein